MTKENVLTTLNNMPLEFGFDELIERLIFIEKTEEARKEIKDGKSISHADVKKIMDTWQK